MLFRKTRVDYGEVRIALQDTDAPGFKRISLYQVIESNFHSECGNC